MEQLQGEQAMRQSTKMTRIEAQLPLQGKRLGNAWGTARLVCVYGVISASDFAHQEPMKGGLIDH